MSDFQPLTPEEKKLYSRYFKLLDTKKTHSISGEAASQFFEKSLLDPQTLFQIWELSDSDSKGYLNQLDFIKALRLIGNIQANPSAAVSAALYNIPAPPPTFQGVTLVADETSGNNSIPVSNTGSLSINNTGPLINLPPVNPSEIIKFASLFQRHAAAASNTSPNTPALITGQEASVIFLRAKLPESTLGMIWELADRSHVGSLSKVEFCLAMYLIQLFLRSVLTQVPPSIPDSIWNQISQALSASGPTASKPSATTSITQQTTGQLFNTNPSIPVSNTTNWTVTSDQVKQYNSLFQSLDKKHSGVLTSQEVAPFLLSSNLKQEDLAAIWDLADLHKLGEFTNLEFSICMFLVAKRLKYDKEPLPTSVPAGLIQSIKSASTSTSTPEVALPPKIISSSGLQPNSTNSSSMNDLVDIFGSTSQQLPASTASNVQRSSSMLMTNSNNFTGGSLNSVGTGNGVSTISPPSANAVSRSYTGTAAQLKKFKPTSNFGQNMMIAEEPSIEQKSVVSTPATSIVPPTIPAPRHSTLNIPPSDSSTSNFSNPAAERELSSLNDQISKHQILIANTHTQTKSLEQQQRDLDLKLEQTRQKLEAILESKKTSELKFSMFKKTHDSKNEQLINLQKMYDLNYKNYDSIRNGVSILQAQCNEKDASVAKLNTDLDSLSQQQTSLQNEKKNLELKLTEINSHNENLNQRYQDLFKMIQDQTNFNNIQKKQLDVLSTKILGIESQIDEKEKELDVLKSQNSKDLERQELLELQLKAKEAKLTQVESQIFEEKSKSKDISNTKTELLQKLESKAIPSSSSDPNLANVAAGTAAIGAAVAVAAVKGDPFSKTDGSASQEETVPELKKVEQVELPNQSEKDNSFEKPSITAATTAGYVSSSSDDEEGNSLQKDLIKNIDDDEFLEDFVVPTRAPVPPPVSAASKTDFTESSSEVQEVQKDKEEEGNNFKENPRSPPTGTVEDVDSSGSESSSDDDDLEGPEDVDKRYFDREMLSTATDETNVMPKSIPTGLNVGAAANIDEVHVYDDQHKPYLSRSAVDAAAAEASGSTLTSTTSSIPGSFNPDIDISSASVAGSSTVAGGVSHGNIAASNIDALTLSSKDTDKANSVMSQVNPDTWFDDEDAVFVSPSVSNTNIRPSVNTFRSVSIDSSASDVFTDAQEEITSPGFIPANSNVGQYLNTSNTNNLFSPSDIHGPAIDDFDAAFQGLNPATAAEDLSDHNRNNAELEFLDNATVRPTNDDSEFHFSEMTPAIPANAKNLHIDDEFSGMKQAIDHDDLDDEFDDGFDDELEGFTGANESNLSSQEKQFKKQQEDDFDVAFKGMSNANHAKDDFDDAFNGMSAADNDVHFEEDEFAEFSNNNNQSTSNDNDEFDSAFNI